MQTPAVDREEFCEVFQDPLLKGHVVYQDAGPFGDLSEQLFHQFLSGIGVRGSKKMEVRQGPTRGILAMKGVEERNLLIRPGAVKARNRGTERLEIEETDRIPESFQELPHLFRVGVTVLAQEILRLHPLRGIQGNERHVGKLDDPASVQIPLVDPPSPDGEDGILPYVLPPFDQ